MKNCFPIFKKSAARRSAYLKCNDLFVSHEGKDTSYLFPLKYCGYRWLENGKAVVRIIEILPYIKQYLKEKKAFHENHDRLVLVYQMVNSHLLLPILEFSKSIMNVMELFLILFQAERPLTLFLHENLKRLIISLMDRFDCPAVLKSASFTKKLMMIDLSNKENPLPDKSVVVGFGTTKALKKLKTVQSPEVRNFRKEVRNFVVKVIEKLRERSPLKCSLSLDLG